MPNPVAPTFPAAPTLFRFADFDTLLEGTLLETGMIPIFDCGLWKLDTKQSSFAPLHHSLNLLGSEASNKKLAQVRARYAHLCVPVVTPEEVYTAGEFATHLYIPGEVCRQGDVLDAARQSKAQLLLERGAFLAPDDVLRCLEKLGDAHVSLIDAGSAFGNSDRVLDPRALWSLRQTGCAYGVNLGELLSPAGATYSWKPQWLLEASQVEFFIESFVRTALALGSTIFVLAKDETGTQAEKVIHHVIAKQIDFKEVK